ncbi:hypothetical protein [Novosphingobium sp.]|uniref:hypothetical protein n=1 Tax=Novosphingobium sp. TaxID=1874826 RepID=UPI00286E0F35|nr:hypothetical protein [Novosphingobium sp.]
MEHPIKASEVASKANISPSYASMILGGSRTPPRPLAIHIFRTTGWRHEIIADLTDAQIEVFESVEPWVPVADRDEGRAA